jgi:hypothetical protein
MPKRRSKKYRKIITKKTNNKTMKKYKKKTYKRGGSQGEEICTICCQKTKDKMLIPNACLIKYGKYRAHKICSDCWWNKFAKEGVSHQCPGCVNNKPLNINPHQNTINVIDLTEDD